jgi:hypothetical protein
MIHDEWRHRAHAADDLLTDIAAVCRGEMPAEAREGGSEAHRAAWEAVCALRSEVAAERAARDDARRMLAECYVLSGADCDGNTVESGWVHLWRAAVEEVRQLRAEYDDHSDIERAEREVERLLALEADAERALVKAELWNYYEAFVKANGAGSITELVVQRDEARTEAATMRSWAEEAAKAENENAEDAKRERAAVVSYLTGANEARCRFISDEVAMRIESGEHRREETK